MAEACAIFFRWRLAWNIYSSKKPSPLFFTCLGCSGVTSLKRKIPSQQGPETPPWKGFRELPIEMEVFLHCYMFWGVSQIIIYLFIFCSSGTQSRKIFCSQGSPRTPCRRFLGGYCIWMSMKGGILHRNYIVYSYRWCTNAPYLRIVELLVNIRHKISRWTLDELSTNRSLSRRA